MGVEVTTITIISDLKNSNVNCPSQETEVTSTPTRPVENALTTKDLQDRNNNCWMKGRWKIKVN